MTKTSAVKKRKNPLDRGRAPQVLFGAGAIGLALITGWRNIEGRIAGAPSELDMLKEGLTGASMEALAAGAAAFAIFRWKYDKKQAIALACVAAFSYVSNTTAASNNLAAQFQEAQNAVESQAARVDVLGAEIAQFEARMASIRDRFEGQIPRDEASLLAAYSWLRDGLEGNPRARARVETERAARAEYDALEAARADAIAQQAQARVRADDEVTSTADDRFLGLRWGDAEIYGMQAIQGLGFWLAANPGKAPPKRPAKLPSAPPTSRREDDPVAEPEYAVVSKSGRRYRTQEDYDRARAYAQSRGRGRRVRAAANDGGSPREPGA